MKIYAKNIVESQVRSNQIRQLEANAIDFIDKILGEIEFPSNPMIKVGRIKGFSDLSQDVNAVNGTIEIYADFNTLSGVKVCLVLPIPVVKGMMIPPSVVSINGFKKVFSQSVIETHIKNLELNHPKLIKYPQPSMEYTHQQVVKPGLFTAPKDPALFDYGTG